MKHCPECNKNYADPTLSFCLNDGAPLIFGSAVDEPATAVLSGDPLAEAATRALSPETADARPEITSPARHENAGKPYERSLIAVGIVLLLAFGAVAGYRYFVVVVPEQVRSIAVMPFVNEGQNPDLEFLSDGMTETLMNSLSQLPGLNVKARGSAFRYKSKETDAQTIGKELDVQAILNGRLVKRGDDLTLFLEMVDTGTGNRTWGEQYTEPISNLIALQNRIARDVSQKLSVKLSGADQKRLGKNYTENAEAYQLFLQGRYFLNKRTSESFRVAIPFFERALANDPNYALAYTGLADSYTLLAIYPGGAPPTEALPKAKEAALKSLSLDSELAEAHASLGQALDAGYDFAGSESAFKRAIELNPNYASAHQWYAELLTELGRTDEALASIERARNLDPMSLIINRIKGRDLIFSGKVDEGIEQLKWTATLDPGFPSAHRDLFDAYQIKGNYAEAVEEFAKATELSGDKSTAALARESFAQGGWKGFLQALTDKSPRPSVLNHVRTSLFYVALGNKNAAINELNAGWEERTTQLRELKADPRFDPLRDDPRFRELYRKVGLP
jgi:TolB-like protein/Tfp pilus assembly protein PilF